LCYRLTVPEKFYNLQQQWIKTPWMFSVASLILGGTLDRHPDMRIVVAEQDIDWIDEFCQDFEKHNLSNPMPYLQKNFWFTTEPERPGFLVDAEKIGFDRLLFATDWPHDKDMGGANSLHDVETLDQLDLHEEHRRQVYCKNYLYLSR